MKETLGLIGIVKNETRYILEWIAHYRSMGVSHIVLYDNDSDEPGRDLLRKLADANLITLLPWSVAEGVSPQMSAYADALERFKDAFEFMAFFDADEFLNAHDGVDLVRWLEGLPSDIGAVGINQRVFGSSGYKTATDELVTERFILSSEPDYVEGHWVKSIYRVGSVKRMLNSHRGILANGRYILPCGRDAFDRADMSGQAREIDFSIFSLHHYIIKSLEEFTEKRARGGSAAATLQQRLARYESLSFFHGRDASTNRYVNVSLALRAPLVAREIERIQRMMAAG